MGQKTLHALIIAIDDYPIAGHKLNGCVNDAKAFDGYLRDFCAATGIVYNQKLLFDAAAKRSEIVKGFDHFQNAQKDDVCVYYYSGHGSQMRAPVEFWDEPDGLSETIVCWDSRLNQAGCRDMADKEIAYLIHKATKDKNVHFLAVTDCCHSGSNTRDLEVVPRMAETCPTAPRGVDEYEGFEFWDNMQPPPSNHVHLAAAKDDQTAKEIKFNGQPRGVFTYSLIETLKQTAGNISYSELVNRIQIKAKNKVKEQTPLCNFYGDDIKTLQQFTFLGETMARPDVFPVQFDTVEQSWVVRAGGIQGVPNSGASFTVANVGKVTTTAVFGNYSTVSGLNLMSQTETFSATLDAVPAAPLRLACSVDSDTEGVEHLKNSVADFASKTIQVVDNQSDADYLVRAWDGAYRLTTKDDTKPLFRRVEGYDAIAAQSFLSRCETVARWRNKLELSNPNTKLSDAAVEIQFRDVDGNPVDEPIFRQPKEGVSAKMQLGITNRHADPLYVSAVYFGANFGITNEFLQSKHIKKDETAWVEYKNSQNIPVNVQKEYRSWGVNEIEEYFKIFVSTDPLSTSELSQDALPLDERGGAKRAIGDEEERDLALNDWRTFDRAFRVVCPLNTAELDAQTEAKIGNIVLKAAGNFSAKVSLSTTGEAKRALESADNQRFVMQKFGNDVASVPLADGMGASPELDVLELEDIEGEVSVETPLTISLTKTSEDETIIPMGFDAASGLYIPLGGQNTEGAVIIETLPSEMATTRGIKSSSKIFFKKMLGKLTGDYEYPILREVIFNKTNEEILRHETHLDTIKARINDPSVKRIVLFIHGWIGSTEKKPSAIKRPANESGRNLDGKYDLILTFDYESMHTEIEETAQMLKTKLEAVGLKAGHGKQFDIIAHSMGGLVSRWFIERLGGNQIVHHLVMLGTPNAGSEIADLKVGATTMLTMALNGWAILQPYTLPLTLLGKGAKMMTRTIDQMQPNGQFIQNLNASPDAGVPYHIVVGNTQKIIKTQPEFRNLFQKVKHTLSERGFYMASDAYLGQPNDMVVPSKSIGSAGQQKNVKTVEVGSDHFGYFIPKSESLGALNDAITGETDVQGI